MKKLLLLVVMCFVGMMVPQGVLAETITVNNLTFETSDNGKTITITSTKAGALANLNLNSNGQGNHAREIKNALAATEGGKIVFVGDFCAADLEKLSSYNYCTQKIVDMSEAKFVDRGQSSHNTYLYHTEEAKQNKSEGDHCIVGATKYKSAPSRSTWVSVEESAVPTNSDGSKQVTLMTPEAFASYINNAYQQYIQVPATYRYYKMVVTMNGYDEVRTWVLVEDETTIPDDATIKTPTDFTEDQRNDNKYFCDNGEYIRFGATFNYYTNPVTYVWRDVSGTDDDYSDGDTSSNYYQSYDDAPNPTDEGQEIIVGGTEYVFHNGSWVDPSQVSVTEEYDFTQMHFDYWGSNVEEIITSNHVGENDALPLQLCNNCSNLKKLTLGSGSFNELGNNVNALQTVDVKKGVTGLGNDMFSQKSSLTKLTFEEGGTEPLTIGEGCFEQCTGLTGTISLPKRISEIGADAFKSTTGIEEVVFNEPSNLTTIHSGTFAESGIKRVTIPKSVILIETNAFQGNTNNTRLEEVTFQGGNTTPLVIKTGAFQNCVNIKDVYVNVKPSERLLICEYNAFDYEAMVAQTQVDGESAVLHFEEDDFNFYAGEWKKGMVFTQSNLNAYKDGYTGTVGNHTYVAADTQNPNSFPRGYATIEDPDGNPNTNDSDGYYHPNTTDPNTFYAPANGWQQFARTDSEREIYVTGDVYMTYSTAKPYSLPTGIYAFRVVNYIPEKVNGVDQKGTMILKMIQEVPVHTGMLLISTDQYVVKNGTDKAKFYFGDPSTNNLTEYPYLSTVGQEKTNLLAPAVENIGVGPVSNEPESETGVININCRPFTHRNFAMNKSSHRFVRLTKCTMPNNKAYLSLPIGMFNNDNESELEGPSPLYTMAGKGLANYEEVPNTTAGAKPSMIFDYDVEQCGMIWPLIQEMGPAGITTGISTIQQDKVAEGIYTLQGVKVSTPNTKGIYIVNGKKVVFK